jgi:hypothetical protein
MSVVPINVASFRGNINPKFVTKRTFTSHPQRNFCALGAPHVLISGRSQRKPRHSPHLGASVVNQIKLQDFVMTASASRKWKRLSPETKYALNRDFADAMAYPEYAHHYKWQFD